MKRVLEKSSKTFITFVVLLGLVNGYQRLGKHKPPTLGVTTLGGKFPPPGVFYHHFVKPGKPLLMKDVLGFVNYDPFIKWSDDYLSKQYGEEMVTVEFSKKENRKEEPRGLRFSKFLDLYKKLDMFMVNTVPDVMKDEVQVPFTLQCGGFQDALHEAVVWLSSGDTRSVLHYDTVDNINCLLDGEKRVVLIDKAYASEIEADGFVREGGYSEVDVDAVDPDKFPGVMAAEWAAVNISKGDCLYIPYKWFHHVYSPPGRNLAVNLWFSHLWWFNTTHCDGIDRSTPLMPLSNFTMASPNNQLRTELLEAFVDLDYVGKDQFMTLVHCPDLVDTVKMWSLMDLDGDSKLTWTEMYSVNMDDLVSRLPACFRGDAPHGAQGQTSDNAGQGQTFDIAGEELDPEVNQLLSGKDTLADTEDTSTADIMNMMESLEDIDMDNDMFNTVVDNSEYMKSDDFNKFVDDSEYMKTINTVGNDDMNANNMKVDKAGHTQTESTGDSAKEMDSESDIVDELNDDEKITNKQPKHDEF